MGIEDKTFDNNYNSKVGKAFRNVNAKFAEYFSEPSEELFGAIVTPISDYISAYYWGDYTAQRVFDIIVKILYNYDLICYNEDTKQYKTYLDKSIVIRLNKLKKAIETEKTN